MFHKYAPVRTIHVWKETCDKFWTTLVHCTDTLYLVEISFMFRVTSSIVNTWRTDTESLWDSYLGSSLSAVVLSSVVLVAGLKMSRNSRNFGTLVTTDSAATYNALSRALGLIHKQIRAHLDYWLNHVISDTWQFDHFSPRASRSISLKVVVVLLLLVVVVSVVTFCKTRKLQ